MLRGIAEILEATFCEQTHYCRWGGEEFTAYMHCKHDYLKTAETLRSTVEKAEFRSGDLVMKVTISVGICIAESMADVGMAEMVNLADQCLYIAKDQGKNCVVSRTIP